MNSRSDRESRVSLRLKLRHLRVFSVVVECGSMAKAAARLRVAQPTVSEVIAELEHTFGIRLLDRTSQGVEPTMYGNALLKRSIAVFDELQQSVRDIEFLADPTAGELKVACPLAIAFTVIPHVIERFIKQYPRVVLHFDEVASASATRDFRELRERKYDLLLGRGLPLQAEEASLDDLNIEILFDDQLVLPRGQSNGRSAAARLILPPLSKSLGSCRHRTRGTIEVWRRLATRAASPCQGPAW
jgi:DNA-binding transcriptional LysR family regulator